MTQTAAPAIPALIADDLASQVAVDLMETGAARIHGPFSVANRVVNAIEKAERMIGQNVTWSRTERGWVAAVTA